MLHQVGRLHAAWCRLPAVEEEDFHWMFEMFTSHDISGRSILSPHQDKFARMSSSYVQLYRRSTRKIHGRKLPVETSADWPTSQIGVDVSA